MNLNLSAKWHIFYLCPKYANLFKPVDAFSIAHKTRSTVAITLSPNSIQRWHLTSTGKPIVVTRQSLNHLISTTEFPVLVSWYFFNIMTILWKKCWYLDIKLIWETLRHKMWDVADLNLRSSQTSRYIKKSSFHWYVHVFSTYFTWKY